MELHKYYNKTLRKDYILNNNLSYAKHRKHLQVW